MKDNAFEKLFLVCSFKVKTNDGSLEVFNIMNGRRPISSCKFKVLPNGGIEKHYSKLDNEDSKDKHISYHTSGLVNYRGFSFESRVFEPLTRLTEKNYFLSISVSNKSKLYEVSQEYIDKRKDEFNLTINLPSLKENFFNISFAIEPKVELTKYISFGVLNLYNLSIFIDDQYDAFDILSNGDYYRTILMVPQSPNKTKPISRYTAEIEFKKKIYNQDGVICYKLRENVYELVFEREMRCRPKAKIKFENDDHKAKVVDDNTNSPAHLRFEVRGKDGSHVKNFKIIKIDLDAEMYEDGHVWDDTWI